MSHLRDEQGARTFRRWGLRIETAPVEAHKISDRGLDFLFSRPARPAGGKMTRNPRRGARGKFAVGGQQQGLVGKMNLVTLHSFTVQRPG